MSFMPREWVWTVVPLIEFKEQKITSHKTLTNFIEKHGRYPKNRIIGTGTLIQYKNIFHIITCKHVAEEGDANLVTMVRDKSDKNNLIIIPFTELHKNRGTSWVLDPDHDLALTVFPIDVEKWDVRTIAEHLFCPQQNLVEGWEIYYFGYPVNTMTGKLFPVVRSGIIASANPLLQNRILIDALAAGGNSGGPVFLNPKPFGGQGAPIPGATPFVGIISETLEKTVDITPFDRLKYVAGISVVVSSDPILKLFKTDEYQKHFKVFKNLIRSKTNLEQS